MEGWRMEEESSESGNAAAAFEALRAEVSRLAEAIEGLRTELVENRGPDLTPTLAQIAKAQNIAAQHLGVIQQHPVLRMTPEQHGQALVNAGQEMMGEPVHQLRDAAAGVRNAGQQLGALIGAARSKRRQLEVLAWSSATALLVGLLLSPFLARLLPFGLDMSVAASIVGTDRWNAGISLMKSTNPAAWETLAAEMNLAQANHAVLSTCRATAAKAKKDQRCTIVVSAPE
jgi:Family of unknown function (DUF6118)